MVDAMVLIGAIALGLVAHKPMPASLGWQFWPKAVVLPCAAAWTLALLLLHLRAPRPSFSRLARRPGWIACLAGSCGIAIALLDRVVRLVLVFGLRGFDSARFLSHYRFPNWETVLRDHLYSLDFIATQYIASAIAGCWLVMAVGGRWRAVPTWIDLFGRATGVFWLLAMPSLWVLQDYAENR